jgi:hypothetical protein
MDFPAVMKCGSHRFPLSLTASYPSFSAAFLSRCLRDVVLSPSVYAYILVSIKFSPSLFCPLFLHPPPFFCPFARLLPIFMQTYLTIKPSCLISSFPFLKFHLSIFVFSLLLFLSSLFYSLSSTSASIDATQFGEKKA